MSRICLIVLTRDEEVNLPFLLESARALDLDLHIVDSGSTDDTVGIAKRAGATVHVREWTNHADQFNWALDTIETDAPWTMRMDADERFTPELVEELNDRLSRLGSDVGGLNVKRQVWFWGRWIRHGGYYPVWLLRIWRTGQARVESRWMDEHVVLTEGREIALEHDIIDENHKGIGFWIAKHNRYADLEVLDILAAETGATSNEKPSGQAAHVRILKERVYMRLPMFFRPFAYWVFRYVLRGGFLDGLPGLVFHFLQGFWYRFLVDAKLWEARRKGGA